MKWKNVSLCVLLVASFIVGAYAVVDYYQKTVELSWTIVEADGIEVDPTSLSFGEIKQGRNATSSFNVTSITDEKLFVEIEYPPFPISGWYIVANPESFALEPGQKQTVTVTIFVFETAVPGGCRTELIVKASTKND